MNVKTSRPAPRLQRGAPARAATSEDVCAASGRQPQSWAVATDAPSSSAIQVSPALKGDSATTVRVYSDFSAIPVSADRWDTWTEASGGDLFASHMWCRHWWKHFHGDRHLQLVLALQNGKLAAILPLFGDRIRVGGCEIRVLRLVGSDYGVTPSSYAMAARVDEGVACAIARAIVDTCDWDVLWLGELPAYQRGITSLVHAFRNLVGAEHTRYFPRFYPQMVFSVANSLDEYLGSLSARERNKLQRELRTGTASNGDSAALQASRCSPLQNLRRLFALHAEHWHRRGRLGHCGDWPLWRAFLEEVCGCCGDANRLLLATAGGEATISAAELGLRFGNRVHWIIGGRSKGISSRVGFAQLMRTAIEANVELIDGLGGDFAYKRRLGADTLSYKAILVVRPDEGAKARVRDMRRYLKWADRLYFRGWTWRLAPALRRVGLLKTRSETDGGYWQAFMRARFLLSDLQSCAEKDGHE